MAPFGVKLNSWRVHGDISSPGWPLKGPCLAPSQHPGCQGHRLAPSGRVKYATLCFQGQTRIPIQHRSIVRTSSPVTSSPSTVTWGRDVLTDAMPLQMSPNLLDGAASPSQPAGCRPSAGTRTPPFLPCAMESLPSPASNASLTLALPFLLPKHRHATSAQETPWAPHFPASGCTSHPVLLFTEVTKKLPRIISGEMNVLASSQAMGKHLISTILSSSHPPWSLEASPTSISPATTWLQASRTPPSSLSLRGPSGTHKSSNVLVTWKVSLDPEAGQDLGTKLSRVGGQSTGRLCLLPKNYLQDGSQELRMVQRGLVGKCSMWGCCREEEEGYEGTITSPVDGEEGAGHSCSSHYSWWAAGKTFQMVGLRWP